MVRTVLVALALSSLSGCKTGGEAETKDVVTQSGPTTRHYYAVGDEARRALCPAGLDSEDPGTFRAQCDVTKTLPLREFRENLERAYSERFKSGEPLADDESLVGGFMVDSLADPGVFKAKAGLQQDVVVSRYAQVFDRAFGFAESPEDDGGSSENPGSSDGGTQILTASFVAPFGVFVTTPIVAQSPVSTHVATVQVTGCRAQVLGMAIAEGQGQPLLMLGAAGAGRFQTISGASRKMAMIQFTLNSPGGFCQVKVTSAGSGGGNGGGNDGVAGDGTLGPEAEIGVVQYNGGFVPQLVAPLAPARVVTEFRIGVPAVCQAEIVKAGILTTQRVAPTKLLDPEQRIYQVNNGAGALASGISVSLNGPLGFCEIPIFAR